MDREGIDLHHHFILLVEDNPDDEALILRALEKAGLARRVEVVRDGVEALDFIFCRDKFEGRNPKNQPAVILLDLKMPRVSGIDVLRRLRSEQATKHVPVAVLTSSREKLDVENCYNLGVNSYVLKPVEFGQLAKVVGQMGSYWLELNICPPAFEGQDIR